jgi:hypothetical protein
MVDENEIRTALETQAREVRVPKTLAARTLKAAQDAKAPSVFQRLRAWRDAQRMRGGVRGYPRWIYAPAAAMLAVGLFAIGSVVTRPPQIATPAAGVMESGVAKPGDAAGGKVTGVVSSGRASLDAGNTSASTDVQSGPASGSAPAPGIAQPDIAPVPPSQPGVFPPKIVRNADVQVQVRRGNFDSAWRKALDVASRYGGFVTNSSTQQTDNRINSGNFTIRVPATKLDSALKDLRGLGTLKSLSTSGNDISGQIVDIDARIRADEAEQAQLLDLIKQATKVSDILPIRTQLATVQQDLESLRGQKKAFANQVDYATINATIFEPNAGPQQQPVPLGQESILLRAWRTAVNAGLTIVAGSLVVLGALVPLALIAIGIWALVVIARKRRA